MPVRSLLLKNLLFLGLTGVLGAIGLAVNWSISSDPGIGAIMVIMLAGLLVVAGMFTGWGSYLAGADRRALERLCRGDPPKSGCLEAIGGTVSNDTEQLISPLTGTQCVAYEYSIHRARLVHHSRGGGRRRRTLCFDGRHMTDMYLDCPDARIRIASFPSLEEFISEKPDLKLAQQHGERLEDEPTVGILSYLSQRRECNRTNYYRLSKDWYLTQPRHWDEGIEMDERVVPSGITLCAIGVWNADLEQLETPYPWRFSRISLEPGDPEEVRVRIGEGAYQLARVSLWCLGLGYGMMLIRPLLNLFN